MTNIIEENRVEELKPGETVIGKITGAYNGEMASFDLFYGGLASSNSKGKALFKVSDDEHLKYLRDFLVNDKSGQNKQGTNQTKHMNSDFKLNCIILSPFPAVHFLWLH